MRIVPITSPLLLLSFLLAPTLAHAQADDELTEEEKAELEAAEDMPVTGDAAPAQPPAQPPGDAPAGAAAAAPAEPAEAEPTEEEPVADGEGLWEPGQEPNRAPPKGKGVIWGRIVDPKGEPAIEAEVKVKGTNIKVYTDLDGYYRLELPPGTYTLELFVELHEPETINGAVAANGQVRRTDATVKPQAGAVEEVLIEDEAERQTVEGLALLRQRSASTGDAVGREEISKTTDSNAAEAAQRVVGANIVGGRFVYVRGLGERYSNSLLSMYPLPSPEPDRAAVPLDVFPATILDSLTIAKTFTPDMPADFGGGSVQIETRSVPDKPLFNVSLQGGINTQATFQNRLTGGSSSTDWLGFDSGMRSMPSSVPSDYPLRLGTVRPDGTTVTREDLTGPGRDMNSPMGLGETSTPVNHGFTVVGGNTFKVGNGQKLGFLASLNYSRKYEKYENAIVREFWNSSLDPRGWAPRVDYRMSRGVDQVRWGAFGKISYLPTQHHKISLSGLHSQMADNMASYWQGTNNEIAGSYAVMQNDWVQRGMTFGVLSGRHEFEDLNHASFDWDASLAAADRSEPDRRDTVYQYNDRIPDPANPRDTLVGWTYVNKTESGRHFWSAQDEISKGGKVDWNQPILRGGSTELAVKFGGLLNAKDRHFSARRFQMLPEDAYRGDPVFNCMGATFQTSCPNSLFVDENIGHYMRLDEGSQQGDAYDAVLNVYAGYGMVDVDFGKTLRVVAGPRIEVTDQRIIPLAPAGGNVTISGAELKATDVLPAVTMVLDGSKKLKTRFAFSQTLARPQLRELAPFAFSDYFGGRTIAGNPDLQLTRITNLDTRVEYWPSLGEVLALTAFYKNLKDPIETVLLPTGGSPMVTYTNSPGADVIGLELEARKNLKFLTKALADFSVISNLTLAWSRVSLQQTGQNTLTSLDRPLTNQAPWVINVALDYGNDIGTNARIAYNVNGPT
ncbi:MAG TPA: carboxypeptidase regulatory-like domain-containing protein, partial [Polyangiaceae bacterium]|nr:carboxypeptidase regulatory-like domain-containing protein [Polyangiaceae bacterium]